MRHRVAVALGDQSARMTRRQFMVVAAAATLIPVLAPGGVGSQLARPEAMPSWLLDVAWDPESAERFGAAYLAARPSEADAGELGAAIAETLDASDPGSGTATTLEGFDRFAEVVREEYAHGEVLLVDGWLLSRTEARLYALVTLLSP
jgi:hypothetical protein